MPTTAKPIPFEICDEMWQRVCRNSDITEDCWTWTEPARNFWFDGNFWSPTRVAWRAFVGDPGNNELMCLCGNKRCFRPGHRRLVPRSAAAGASLDYVKGSQLAAARKKARTECRNGHPYNDTTRILADGSRDCRKCNSVRSLARYYRLKGEGVA